MAIDCGCKTSANLGASGCEDFFVAGAQTTIYVANTCDIASYTATGLEVSAITMEVDPLTTNPTFWYKINAKQDSVNGTTTLSRGTNNSNMNHSVVFNVSGLDVDSKEVLNDLLLADLTFIVVDNSGETHIFGPNRGLRAADGSSLAIGAAQDDFYGATLTFEGRERQLAYSVLAGTTIEVFNGTTTDTVTL